MVAEWIVRVGRLHGQLVIRVPAIMATDSRFPFREGDEVRLKIEDGRLVVEKA